MVRILGLAAVVLTLVAAIAIDRAEGAEKLPGDAKPIPAPAALLKIGMLDGMFRDVPKVQVQAAMIPFKRMFKEMVGEEVDIVILPDHKTLADRLETGECSIGIFHGFEFAWSKKDHPTLEAIVVTVPVARKIQACLVVDKDSTTVKAHDLEGDCVALPKSSKAHCLLFLDRLRETLPANACGPLHRNTLTPEDVLDGVINGDFPASVVDTSSLSIYQSMKPGAFDQLRIVQSSEQFPPAVIVSRKGSVDPRVLDRLRKTLIAANTTPQGRLMLTLWSLKGIEQVPADFEQQLDHIRKIYPEKSIGAGSKTSTSPR